jgi:hypothetical protein
MTRMGALLAVVVLCAAWPASAAAQRVTFAHGTIDQRLTTSKPAAPAGSVFNATYHAAGDPAGQPPYMRGMTFHPPPGQRYDTSVPERCTASDVELYARGVAACPEGSRLGGGTTTSIFMGQASTLPVDVFNNEGEQIMVVSSPGQASVVRGRFGPDGSITYESPTCFPNAAGCPVDNALQTGSSVSMPAYTRVVDGVTRSYITTPPKCPKSGRWQQRIRLWWADGTEDTVVTEHPCERPKPKPKMRKRKRSR